MRLIGEEIYSTFSYPIVYSISQFTGALLGLICILVLKKTKIGEKETLGLGFLLAFLGTITLYITYSNLAPKNPLSESLAFLKIFFEINIPVLLSSFFLAFILPFIWEFLRSRI